MTCRTLIFQKLPYPRIRTRVISVPVSVSVQLRFWVKLFNTYPMNINGLQKNVHVQWFVWITARFAFKHDWLDKQRRNFGLNCLILIQCNLDFWQPMQILVSLMNQDTASLVANKYLGFLFHSLIKGWYPGLTFV